VNQVLAVLAVALGGALGSVARYAVSNLFFQRLGAGFPWGTFAINVSGAFVIGVVMQLAATRVGLSPLVRLFIATGVLGGYTTFSAFAYEAYTLGGEGLALQGIVYAAGSVVGGVAAAYLGVVAVRALAAL
jgi:fluoride exporter